MQNERNGKKKMSWIGPALIIVTFMTVIIAGLLDGTLPEALAAVRKADKRFIALAGLCYGCFVLSGALSIKSFLKRMHYDLRLKDSIVSSLTCIYYSNITPGGYGGQPMQVLTLTENGIPAGIAMSAVISFMICWHLIRMVLVTGLLIPYHDFVIRVIGSYRNIFLFGYVYNWMIVILWIVVGFTKKPIEILSGIVIRMSQWIHKSEDKAKVLEGKINQTALVLYKSMRKLIDSPAEIVRQVLLSIVYVISLTSILYFSCRAIGIQNISYLKTTTMSICQEVSASYIPTPGAAGAQELIFGLFFKNELPGSDLLAVMLIWRFMTYYIGLILGAIVILLKNIKFSKPSDQPKQN